MSEIEVELHERPETMSNVVVASFGKNILEKLLPTAIFERVVEKIAQVIAEKYTKKYAQDIMGKISQDAIATMVVAQSGNAIKDMLDKKLPDKIIRETKTQIYQRGIFGGMTRIK
jgi:hypothetical protein